MNRFFSWRPFALVPAAVCILALASPARAASPIAAAGEALPPGEVPHRPDAECDARTARREQPSSHLTPLCAGLRPRTARRSPSSILSFHLLLTHVSALLYQLSSAIRS